MARLLRPVTKIISVMPHAAASSTAYWMSGLSTIGSISFGLALVTGRKRLPKPATGNTAFFSLAGMELEILQHFDEFFLAEHRHPERAGLVQLRAGVVARHDEVGFFRHRARNLVTPGLDRRACLVPRHPLEGAGQHEALDRARRPGRRGDLLPAHAALDQAADHLPVVRLVEELADRARHDRPDVG